MTIGATLDYGCVLPEERSALVRVTAGAKFKIRRRDQERIGRRAVGLVAIGALDLALVEWHVGAFAELGAFFGVAGKAGIANRGFAQQTACRGLRHRVVAVTARQIFRFVNRSRPVQPRPTLVALKTGGIHLANIATAITRKPDDLCRILGRRHVRAARAVARFAALAL